MPSMLTRRRVLLGGTGVPLSQAAHMLGAETDGFAIDFRAGHMLVRDSATAANAYAGPIANKLSITGSLLKGSAGSHFDAGDYARLAIASWPYSTSAITIAGEVIPDAATDATQRCILNIDPGGNDRLNLIFPSGTDKLTFSIGLGGSALNVIALTGVAPGVPLSFVAVAGPAGVFLIVNNVNERSFGSVLAANAAPLAFSGIGTESATTAGAASTQPLKGRLRYLVVLPRAVSEAAAIAGLPFPDLTFAAIGDSHTFNDTLGVALDEFYPARVADSLGVRWLPVNAGNSGDTTAEMMSRRAGLIGSGVPDIAAIYGGTNDSSGTTTVQASPSPTDTVFSVAAGKGTRYAADAWITVDGESAQIESVATDAITLTGALAGGAPTAGDAVLIDTQKNLEAITDYIQGEGCANVLMLGQHYLNFSAGGDTTSAERADLETLRNLQEAAATAAGAIYVDNYAFMRARILAGTDTQGDFAWHVEDSNTHLNAYGEGVLASAILAEIQSEGWV